MHRYGRIRLEDLNRRRGYRRWPAYCQSKLANLMFAYDLQHRLIAAGSTVRSLAAQPGYAATNLQSHTESLRGAMMVVGNRLFGQPAATGALPALYAATVPDLPGGGYFGPSGPGELRGHPRQVGASRASYDRRVQRELWSASEALTGVRFDFTS